MKKFLALLLSLSMLIMCAPGISLVASAEVVELTQDADGYYLITNEAEFIAAFADGGSLGGRYHSEKIKQTANLVIGAEYAYLPYEKSFSGIYDGNGKSIDVVINSTADFTGLFYTVAGATVKNLTISGTISGVKTGAIAGRSYDATIENCKNYADITASSNAAGILGYVEGYNVSAGVLTIRNTVNYGDVNGYSASGMTSTVYLSEVTIDGCANYGNITSTYEPAGFISRYALRAGEGNGLKISNSFNAGEIKSTANGGRAAGFIANLSSDIKYDQKITIENCFNAGKVISPDAVVSGSNPAPNPNRDSGSIFGRYGMSADYDYSVTLTNVYDVAQYTFDILGGQNGTTKLPLYGNGSVKNLTTTNVVALGDGATQQDIIDSFKDLEGWKWDYNDNYDYPDIEGNGFDTTAANSGVAFEFYEAPSITVSGVKIYGEGTEDAPFEIENIDQFMAIFSDENTENDTYINTAYYYKQKNDLTLPNDYLPYHKGTSNKVIYDGNGKSIEFTADKDHPIALPMSGSNNTYFGLFAQPTAGTIKNLTVTGIITLRTTATCYVGSIAGRMGCNIENCTNRADIVDNGGYARIGGLASQARTDGRYIKDSANFGNISGNQYVAGIIGNVAKDTTIENCFNFGNITGASSIVGGFVYGWGADLTIKNSANLGTVKGTGNIGGLLGCAPGTVSATLVIEDSYNAGEIISSHAAIGGLVGNIVYGKNTNTPTAIIRNCFNAGKIGNNGTSAFNIIGSRADADVVFGEGASVTLENFYDIANPDKPVYREVSDATDTYTGTVTISAGTKVTNDPAAIAELGLPETNWETDPLYQYPALKNVVYLGEAGRQVAETGATVFVGEDASTLKAELPNLTFEVNPVGKYAIAFATFNDVVEGFETVEYGMLIAKEGGNVKSADALSKTLYTQKGEAENNVDGKYGMLFYNGINGLNGNYFLKPYVKYTHNDTGVSFYVYGAGITQEI